MSKIFNYETDNYTETNNIYWFFKKYGVDFILTKEDDLYTFTINKNQNSEWILKFICLLEDYNNNKKEDKVLYKLSRMYFESKEEEWNIGKDIYDNRFQPLYFKTRQEAVTTAFKTMILCTNKFSYNGTYYKYFGFIIDKIKVNENDEETECLDYEIYHKTYDEYIEYNINNLDL